MCFHNYFILLMHSLGNSLNVNETLLNQQLFLPEELESIKLTSLRKKRQDLEDKLKLISNRISFRHKKEESELKRYIRSQERSRLMSETKNYKKFNEMLKDQLQQKKQFEIRKKARQVQQFRQSQSHRRQLINQAVRDRKNIESEKVRRTKRLELQQMSSTKQTYEMVAKEKYEQALRSKQRQKAKKKYYWLVEKRLTFQQGMLQEAQIYEKQVQDFHRKIQHLREEQEKLRLKEEHATEVLRCAEQNYELLKKA